MLAGRYSFAKGLSAGAVFTGSNRAWDAWLLQVGNKPLHGFDRPRRRAVEVRDQLVKPRRRLIGHIDLQLVRVGEHLRVLGKVGEGRPYERDAVRGNVGREHVGPPELHAREHEAQELA